MDTPTPVVLVTHGTVGEALKAAAEDILGPQAALWAAGRDPEEPAAAFRNRVAALVEEATGGTGPALILADLAGGSASSAPLPLVQARPGQLALVAGLNLAMLLTVLIRREEAAPLTELVAAAIEAGRDSILDVEASLKHGQRPARH
ncbi:putative PTS sugar transporter subunit IIA [Candidatus Hydrogenisulfobacillus filiaventi]|uniref:Putative PTS sugar transporter subunit IIA n=1 Tax=Candidatus Hydrogenisulfobacillus filiaventi TaxID=2707344 RepID=A0A6F8ZBZ4_9FIRM|nr:hypothetical protein [Bacillota bacterium]CAB1127546.1 putative PTS sugar transporter subunit IIA [Candidatus Hydrogenisulfobacillus filiaventi]